jgi:hypothetical protein
MAGTRWVKIDTSYLRNPKITSVSAPATLMHLASILWTADQLTDGNIPKRTLNELAIAARISRPVATRCAIELEHAGLWERNGDGWHLHDFAKMNRQALRATVENQRTQWRIAKGLE